MRRAGRSAATPSPLAAGTLQPRVDAAERDRATAAAYALAHPSRGDPRLVAWAQDKRCRDVEGGDSATDGDLDVAYGLLLAHAQWGSSGASDDVGAARRVPRRSGLLPDFVATACSASRSSATARWRSPRRSRSRR